MDQLFNKAELFLALQSCGLGIAVGAIFAILGFKPPSPDNLSGIMGIMGIFLGWLFVGVYIK
ncbi:MAG: DUF1427 family protein [Candidatus Marinimicrobia bacterium]|nr:DUF1427 family protein [Candidatus Neomarinimicrobiota bacterium]